MNTNSAPTIDPNNVANVVSTVDAGIRVDDRNLIVDGRTRLERIEHGRGWLLCKSYSFVGVLSLRTIWRRSRAEREFCNLQALAFAGVPCVQAVRWTEQRARGCVRACAVVTEFVDGADDLRSVLRHLPESTERRRLAGELGALVRTLHGAGFRSSTASLRNVLRLRDGSLALCDQPYASRLWGPIATWARGLDLFDTLFSPSRCNDWTRGERLRGLRRYHGGDAVAARATWRRMSRRSNLWFRVARQLSRLAVFRRPTRPVPHSRP